jgi:hypothetical protein
LRGERRAALARSRALAQCPQEPRRGGHVGAIAALREAVQRLRPLVRGVAMDARAEGRDAQ